MCPSQMCNFWWTSWAFYGLLASPGCLCSFGFHHGRCLSCCRGFIAYQVTGFYQNYQIHIVSKKKTNPVLIRPGGFSRASECSCPMAWWPSRCRCGCPSKFFTPPGLMGLMFQVSNRRLENSTSWHRGETPCAISRSFWDWLSQSMSNPISKQWIRDSCSFCTAGHQ